MHTLLMTAASLLAMCGAALAADLSRSPRPFPVRIPADTSVYMGWSGFYIGLNAGGAFGNGRSDFSIAGNAAFASVDNYLAGAVGGAQAGFNWQIGATVVGIETDIQASGLKGGINTPCAAALCGIALTASYSQSVPWFGTVRGRLGFADRRLCLCSARDRCLCRSRSGHGDVQPARDA